LKAFQKNITFHGLESDGRIYVVRQYSLNKAVLVA